ncbi:MAG: hypothetical protein ACKVU4_11785 [Phycisphaerales bacterium]
MNSTRHGGVVAVGFVSAVAAMLSAAAPALAQWSTNPGVNLPLANLPGEQVQPKVRPRTDGGVYVSWFDNATGGYDVRLQRLNAAGVEQWAHNGLLIADRSFSSTQDYGLAVDGSGPALISYRDDRATGIQVGVNRVDAAGMLLWGPLGVVLTSTTDFIASPKVCGTTDGLAVVGWTQGNNGVLQKLDANGQPQWGAGVTISPAAGTYTVTDVVPGELGGVIVGLVKGPERHLHAQKYDANGQPMWGLTPLVIFSGSALQFGYFPAPISTGVGGAVFAWYETGGTRNVYAQHVTPIGVQMYGPNGLAVVNNQQTLRLSPGFAYDSVTGDLYVFWTDTNQAQSLWGLSGQKISFTGVRVWGDSGVQLLPLTANQNSFVKTVVQGDGALVAWFEKSGASRVMATRVSGATGAPTWAVSPRDVCSVVSGKSRLDACVGGGVAKLVWGDERSGPADVYAQNIHPGGWLGAACFPDCNEDGVLSVADFGCFQGRYVLGSQAADCNGDGQLSVGDFGCFQGKFVVGCP